MLLLHARDCILCYAWLLNVSQVSETEFQEILRIAPLTRITFHKPEIPSKIS